MSTTASHLGLGLYPQDPSCPPYQGLLPFRLYHDITTAHKLCYGRIHKFFRVKKTAGEECQLLNFYTIFFPFGKFLWVFNYMETISYFFFRWGGNMRRDSNGTITIIWKYPSSAQCNSYCKFYDPLCSADFMCASNSHYIGQPPLICSTALRLWSPMSPPPLHPGTHSRLVPFRLCSPEISF